MNFTFDKKHDKTYVYCDKFYIGWLEFVDLVYSETEFEHDDQVRTKRKIKDHEYVVYTNLPIDNKCLGRAIGKENSCQMLLKALER